MEQETSSSSSSSGSSCRKRAREGEEAEIESQCSKRLCEQNQELQSIFEEAEHLDESQQGLVSDVMRSLEEELGCCSSDDGSGSGSGSSNCSDTSSRPLDIGYLLEATDDELGISPAEQPALVEAEDLLRAESWSRDDWASGHDFSVVEGLMDEIAGEQQQEWLRKTLEMFLSSSSVAAAAAATAVLGQGFEPATAPVLEAGLIL